MKVTNNLNIKMNRDRLWNDRYREVPISNWNDRYRGCAGRQHLGCDAGYAYHPGPRPDSSLSLDKLFDKKVTPIVKEQAKTPSF